MIEAVFFDAVGTLIYLPKPVGHHYQLVAERHGLRVDGNALDAAFRAVWKQMPVRPPIKSPRLDDDKAWWRELVQRVFEMSAGQGRLPPLDACFEDIYAHFAKPGVWELYPEAAGVLAALAGRYRLGIISNFDNRLRLILDQLGVLGRFEKLFLSSEAGADKPDPHIFQCALAAFGVDAAHALHAGDDPVHDWEGAAAAGMHVYKLRRPGDSLTGVVEYLERS